MEQSELNQILEQHRIWLETNGVQGSQAYLKSANLEGAQLRGADLRGANLKDTNLSDANLSDANLEGANLIGANLEGANLQDANLKDADLRRADLRRADLRRADLRGAYLWDANLTNAILPDIFWIIPGCLVQLNQISCSFYLEKERKWDNFIQDSFGLFIQDNPEESTFDMLVGDRIIRGIPDWVKYSGLKKAS